VTAPRHPLAFGLMAFPQLAPYGRLVQTWQRAEALGFDAVYVADETSMEFPGAIGYEAWSLLGAAARETSRVRLGTLVTPIAFRHPLLLAMSVSTIDHASNGRAMLGIGAGGGEKDEAGVGLRLTPGERVERLAEQLQVIERLFRGETVTKEDGYYRMREAVIEAPLQKPRPPIVVAGQGPRTIALAARHADVWNSLGGQPPFGDARSADEALAVTRDQVRRLDDACRAIGREPAGIRRSVLVYRHQTWGSPSALADYVARYRELGFDEFVVISPGTREGERVFERVAADVLPALRGSA
jgi:alkanesulfonate monooxygenase SsuD/methylene tetrahydromethanopterin reductase-like flavin-dependent oxidoreductase (luciferase family)